MPLLDVSDLLSDPMFAEETPIRVRRTLRMVSDRGRAVDDVVEILEIEGVVTQGSGSPLVRAPEGSRILSTITVHSDTRLTTGTDEYDADVVIWGGRDYTVMNAADWSTFGAGFCSATCAAIAPAGG
ncbi:hypothetical protein [Salinarimonas soli]|uniref:Bacteriophage protein n=1 Tax=Salinarimonas soli TaxID=1638099 RepID=A0A5B2VFD8_9HYPH|nr:hypothetical protein [Salinarimonas soli]KAA2237674.1 hypothetical protein F0L46_08310 [Salinarimonas soli]